MTAAHHHAAALGRCASAPERSFALERSVPTAADFHRSGAFRRYGNRNFVNFRAGCR